MLTTQRGPLGGRLTPTHWASHPYDIYDDNPILNVMEDPRHLVGILPPRISPPHARGRASGRDNRGVMGLGYPDNATPQTGVRPAPQTLYLCRHIQIARALPQLTLFFRARVVSYHP